jgi:hypothetical protein
MENRTLIMEFCTGAHRVNKKLLFLQKVNHYEK